MAKKVKRKVSPVVTAGAVSQQVETRVESAAGSAPTSGAARAFARRTPSVVEFNPDYSYIVNDLKRIGLMAGSFFVILIVLSFFLK